MHKISKSSEFTDDNVLWQKYVRNAENRGAQVIRYSDEKELVEKCHYALAWIYWHEKDFAKKASERQSYYLQGYR